MPANFVPSRMGRTDCGSLVGLVSTIDAKISNYRANPSRAATEIRQEMAARGRAIVQHRNQLQADYDKAVADLQWDIGLAIADVGIGIAVPALLVVGTQVSIAGGVILLVGWSTFQIGHGVFDLDIGAPSELAGLVLTRGNDLAVLADAKQVTTQVGKRLAKAASVVGDALTVYEITQSSITTNEKRNALNQYKVKGDQAIVDLLDLSALPDSNLVSGHLETLEFAKTWFNPINQGCPPPRP